MRRKVRNRVYAVVTAVMACFLISCAFSHYGTIAPDEAVTKSFEAYQMAPDMNYYYSGSDVIPNAVVGLKKEYTIEPDFWKPIIQPKVFRDMIEEMKRRALRIVTDGFFGFTIKDDKGNTIGVWYSLLRAKTYVEMGKDKTVVIKTPPLLLYKQMEGDGTPVKTIK